MSRTCPHLPGDGPPVTTLPSPTALWQEGWLHAPSVRHLASPNFGARPTQAVVDLVVIHSISLPPGEYGTGCVQRLFTNQLDWDAHPYFQGIRGLEVSSHFFIDRSGALTQFVPTTARAWHAGASRWRGRDNCNDDSIGIELEGLEGRRFTAGQYATLAALCEQLAQQHPLRWVAGHEHIAPGRKADPGAGFDWPRLYHALPTVLQSRLQFPPDTLRAP